MTQEDDRFPDSVEQRDTCSLYAPLLFSRRSEKLDIGGIIGVEVRIAHHPFARPLGVESGLRPQFVLSRSRESLLDDLG